MDLAELRCDRETLEETFNQDIDAVDADILNSVIFENARCGNLEILQNESPCESISESTLREWIVRGAPQTRSLGFTSAGGTIWEWIHNPDWARYIKYYTLYTSDVSDGAKNLYLESTNRERILELCNLLRFVGYDAAPDIPVSWATVVDWGATYWKTLPLAFQVTIACTEISDDEPKEPMNSAMKDFLVWHR